jgi:hypothetical protein
MALPIRPNPLIATFVAIYKSPSLLNLMVLIFIPDSKRTKELLYLGGVPLSRIYCKSANLAVIPSLKTNLRDFFCGIV